MGEYISFLDSDGYDNFEMHKIIYESANGSDFTQVVVTGTLFVKDDYYLNIEFKFL